MQDLDKLNADVLAEEKIRLQRRLLELEREEILCGLKLIKRLLDYSPDFVFVHKDNMMTSEWMIVDESWSRSSALKRWMPIGQRELELGIVSREMEGCVFSLSAGAVVVSEKCACAEFGDFVASLGLGAGMCCISKFLGTTSASGKDLGVEGAVMALSSANFVERVSGMKNSMVDLGEAAALFAAAELKKAARPAARNAPGKIGL